MDFPVAHLSRLIDGNVSGKGSAADSSLPCRARQPSARRTLAVGAPDFGERVFAVQRELFEEARQRREILARHIGKQQIVDAPLQRIDRADGVLASPRQADQDAASVPRAGLLGQQPLADQASDLGGDVSGGKLGVILASSDVRGVECESATWAVEGSELLAADAFAMVFLESGARDDFAMGLTAQR